MWVRRMLCAEWSGVEKRESAKEKLTPAWTEPSSVLVDMVSVH